MNDYFCVMPFFGQEFYLNKPTTPCCLLPKDSDIKKIQLEMLNKKRPNECQTCWNLEKIGQISDRQLKNSSFDFYSDTDITVIENNCISGNFSHQIIKLYTSNLCNSSCVTCGPKLSTHWQFLKNIPIKKKIISDKILDSIDWSKVKILTFVGGEPLFEKRNLDILEKLSLINPNCFISFVTNGSVKLTDHQTTIFKRFKNLNICLSIDGIQKQFEYIRYPLKWDDLLENIKNYRNIGAHLSVSFTISNLNILYYNEIVNWFDEQKLQYNHNLVTFPAHFNIEVLPEKIKKKLPLVKNVNHFNHELFLKFANEITEQDKIKNISIKNYLPELYHVIKNYTS